MSYRKFYQKFEKTLKINPGEYAFTILCEKSEGFGGENSL
jgi:hypothetical protein